MSIEKVKKSLSQKYEFIKLIGKGGFAEVYLAKDKLLEREVAIKILLSQHAEDTEIVERFIREARLYAKFDHKNLIPIYETGIVEKNAFLVMKYINGESLKDIVDRQGSLNSHQTLNVIKGMASALTYIHGKGIIHRDIKPANILIEKATNRIYLADFGIARPISSKTLTQTGMLIGTPYYISPEQINKGVADKRSDIYALGTTLYEIISGKPVFKCETSIEVLYKHVNEEPQPIASISPNITMEMKHIVEKCLKKNPKDRFQNANEILEVITTGKFDKTIKNDLPKKKSNANTNAFFIILVLLIFIVGLIYGIYIYYPKILEILNINQNKITKKKVVNEENIENNNGKKIKLIKDNSKDLEATNETKKSDKHLIVKKEINDTVKNDDVETKKPIVKLSYEDKQYERNFELAKNNYLNNNFSLADKYLKKAKPYKETLELYQLDEKIQKKLQESVKKKETKTVVKKADLKTDKKAKTNIIKKTRTISLFRLNQKLFKSYLSKIDTVRITVSKNRLYFKNKVTINGQLNIKVKIDEFGKLTFLEINQNNLIVTPLVYKKKIVRRIWKKLTNIKFQPPLDKKGNKVILGNWRITFIVSKFKNKIILRKV